MFRRRPKRLRRFTVAWRETIFCTIKMQEFSKEKSVTLLAANYDDAIKQATGDYPWHVHFVTEHR